MGYSWVCLVSTTDRSGGGGSSPLKLSVGGRGGPTTGVPGGGEPTTGRPGGGRGPTSSRLDGGRGPTSSRLDGGVGALGVTGDSVVDRGRDADPGAINGGGYIYNSGNTGFLPNVLATEVGTNSCLVVNGRAGAGGFTGP